MRFHIMKLILWLRNGKIRELEFKNNKVNVITGESETGKSEIISIIDYCFYASQIDITEEKINENVAWYGVKFSINDKIYTIARGRIQERRLSKDYFFSPVGNVPKLPKSNMDESDIKKIIEKEFSITDKTVFSIGSKNITLGSKISPRYFFMFNTQTENIIINSEVFFDKQNNDKYRDALTRIFDLAVGIESEDNLTLRAKISELNKEINSLNRKKTVFDKAAHSFLGDLKTLAEQAQAFNIIDYEVFNVDVVLPKLKAIVTNYKEENISINIDKLNKLKTEKNSLIRKIRNLKKFKSEYEEYRKLEAVNLDSLKPVIAIKNAYYKLLDLPDLDLIINVLNEEYHEIKKNISGRPPFDFNVDEKIRKYELDVDNLNMQIIDIPINDTRTSNEIDKLMFIGELKAKISLYENSGNEFETNKVTEELKEKTKFRDELEKATIDYTEQKNSVLRLLDELIQNYIEQSEEAIPTYKGYKSAFQYKEKRLKLRKPKAVVPTKVGSSSNHLFLHLCLFLGLHELIIRQNSPYVPNWLILDQPSRPYFGEEDEEKVQKQQKDWKDVSNTDRAKIKTAMRLLNDFITYVNNDLKKDFQIVVLEHIPKSIWKEDELENFFQVDEDFKNGNALIRFDINGEPY